MFYKDIHYLLIYFVRDKSVAIFPTEEINGWSELFFNSLLTGKKVYGQADYDCLLEKVSFLTYLLLPLTIIVYSLNCRLEFFKQRNLMRSWKRQETLSSN